MNETDPDVKIDKDGITIYWWYTTPCSFGISEQGHWLLYDLPSQAPRNSADETAIKKLLELWLQETKKGSVWKRFKQRKNAWGHNRLLERALAVCKEYGIDTDKIK